MVVGIRQYTDKFNSDNDDINKIKIFVNSYIDKFEKLTIDELEEYSNKFKSLRALIKKIEYSKNTLSELNDIVTKYVGERLEFPTDQERRNQT